MSLQPISRRQWAVRITLLLICLFALGYSVYFAETVGKYAAGYTPDESHYIAAARRLIETHTFSYWGEGPDAYVTPGFPVFLAVCMDLFGAGTEGLHRIKLLQALLSALTVFLTYLLGKQLTGRDSVGLMAAGLIAFNATYAAYSRLFLTETLYFFLMMLFFVVFHRSIRQDKPWPHLLSGILCAAACLTRPLLAVTIPFLWLPYLRAHRKEPPKTWLLPMALFAAGALILFLPWWIRNLVTLKQFIPFCTQSNPFFAGLAPDPEALGLRDPNTLFGNLKLLLTLLLEHPFQTLYWLTFEKFSIIFQTTPATATWKAVTTLCKDLSVYLGLAGCAAALIRREHVWPVTVFLVYLVCIFLGVPTSRYALQYLPFLAIAASYAVTLLFSPPEKSAA